MKKERKVSTEVRALAQQLVEARQQREKESAQRRAVLTKLKDEFRDIQTQTATESKLLEQEIYLKEAADQKAFQVRIISDPGAEPAQVEEPPSVGLFVETHIWVGFSARPTNLV